MGILDKLKDLVKGKGDQIDSAIDKAADLADDKTGGKHTDKIEQAADKAKDVVDKLDDQA
jgi:ABC-type transporter Mla subunit MlaD